MYDVFNTIQCSLQNVLLCILMFESVSLHLSTLSVHNSVYITPEHLRVHLVPQFSNRWQKAQYKLPDMFELLIACHVSAYYKFF